MITNVGYKIEKINIASVFRGYQNIVKVENDDIETNIAWVYATRSTTYGINHNLLKVDKSTLKIIKIYDFGINAIYAISVTKDYIAALSIPDDNNKVRYLSIITRATTALTSLRYTVTNETLEFDSINNDNSLIFDSKFFWVIPNNTSLPIKKIDAITFGAASGVAGLTAPGGSSLNAVTSDVTNYATSNNKLDNKGYKYGNYIYVFPVKSFINPFKIGTVDNSKTEIINEDWIRFRNRVECSIGQYGLEVEFSTAGQSVYLALRDDADASSPVTSIATVDLMYEDFADYKIVDMHNFKGDISHFTLDNDKLMFTQINAENKSFYINLITNELTEYAIVTNDETILKDNKYPALQYGDNVYYTIPTSTDMYKLTNINVGRVYIRHIDETNTIFKNEILYEEIGSNYEAKFLIVEGKEIAFKTDNYKGVFTEKDIIVELSYAPPRDKTSVKVIFKDDKDVILKEYLLEGYVGDSYTTQELDIEGYTLVSKPVSETKLFIDINSDMVYIYRALTDEEKYLGSSFVCVKHVDQNNNTIFPSQYFRYSLGDTYTVNAKTTNAYNIVGDTSKEGICVNNTEYVAFTYSKNNIGIVKVDYSCEGIVFETEYVTGTIGQSYSVVPKALDNFNAVSTAARTGTYTSSVITVSVDCTPKTSALFVKHTKVYDNTEFYATEVVIPSNNIIYKVNSKIVDNYKTVNEYPTEIVYSTESQSWTYNNGNIVKVTNTVLIEEILYNTIYANINVVHKDPQGNPLFEETLRGLVGERYETQPLDLDQYEVNTTTGNTFGIIPSTDITVEYVYKIRQCNVEVHHQDFLTGDLIEKEVFTGNYGTNVTVGVKTYSNYMFLYADSTYEPTAIINTYARITKVINIFYIKFDTSMLIPSLNINKELKGVSINNNGYNSIINGLRYKIYRKLSTDSVYANIFAKANVKVLNIVEPDTNTITFTNYNSQQVTIPSTAILKKWCETTNNNITVDYVEANDFNLYPKMYIYDENGAYKYDVIINGSYDTCTISKVDLNYINNFINDGYGYLECSNKLIKNNRDNMTNKTPTEGDLLISVIKELAESISKPIFTDTNVTSTLHDEDIDIDKITYDKVKNTIQIKVKLVDNGSNATPVIYDYYINLINSRNGKTYKNVGGNVKSSINCTLPISGYNFVVDKISNTIPSLSILTKEDVFEFKRPDNISLIDYYIHAIAFDDFMTPSNTLHYRYYKEITIEDLTTIDDSIHYSPKLIKQNHRFRGPVESEKINNFNTETLKAIEELMEILDSQYNDIKTLSKNNTESKIDYLIIKGEVSNE